MNYAYDDAKRATVIKERGLDLALAWQAFDGFHLSKDDIKYSEQEKRTITVGQLKDGAIVIVIWTVRGDTRRIITMWKANDQERQRYCEQRDRSE